MVIKAPDCPKHKTPMRLLRGSLIIKTYFCETEECGETKDVIMLIMKGQKFYIEKQKETEAEINIRKAKSMFREGNMYG